MSISKIDGTLVFVQVQKPTPCFSKDKGSEWKASIVVTEDFADTWDETYPKQPAKQIKTAEFKDTYKIDPPFPEQRKQYIITVRKNTKLGNGDDVPEIYQPKVFIREEGMLKDITKTVLPANGSLGQISVETYEGQMGVFARLKNVLVTDMIVYEGGSSADPGSEFSDEPAPEPKRTPAKAAPAAKAKVQIDADSEDSPF